MDQLLPSWTRKWISGTDKLQDRGEYELVGTALNASEQGVEKDREPTESERKTLRKIADHLPWYVKKRAQWAELQR